MPSSYVDIDRDEMEYVDGGLSISRNVFRYTVTATVIAACAFLGGGFAVSGLRTVLGSYSIKMKLISAIVKGIGVLGIKGGNLLASKFVSVLIACVGADFMGNIFDRYIDPLDGNYNGWVKVC